VVFTAPYLSSSHIFPMALYWTSSGLGVFVVVSLMYGPKRRLSRTFASQATHPSHCTGLM